MKKLAVLMLTGCLIFTPAGGSAGMMQAYAQDCSSVEQTAADAEEGDAASVTFSYDTDEDGNAVLIYSSVDKSVTSVTVPAEIDGHRVTGLNGTFIGCSHLTSITLPDSITDLGDRTFYGFLRLPSFPLPSFFPPPPFAFGAAG